MNTDKLDIVKDGRRENESAIINQISQRRKIYGEDVELMIVVDSGMWDYMAKEGFDKHCKGISNINVVQREGKSIFEVYTLNKKINMSSDSIRFINGA